MRHASEEHALGRGPLEAKHEKLPGEPGKTPTLDELLKKGGSGRRRIRCPKCAWQPRSESRWMCLCGHSWNTFDTQGRCPGCGYQWHDTACLRCTQWSKHRDWYDDGSKPAE